MRKPRRPASGPYKDNMKPFYKKILSFLTIICCVAGSLGTVRASESESVPRAVFVNEQKDLPDLYIGKTVVTPEGYAAPADDTFTFLLTLNGDAAERNYVLCDLTGKELTKDQLKDQLDLHMEQNTFKTASNGTFSLRAGYMAKFTGVGVNTEYDVSELLDADAPYEQTSPASGVHAHGFLPAEGKEIVFTNTYVPRNPEGKAILEVKKTIAFPEGFTPPKTPDFTFQVTVDRALYAGKSYTVRDDASGQTVGNGTTSETGTFTLKGGQTAVFAGDDLEAGLDYEVTEQPLPGWHNVSRTGDSGALAAPLTRATFHNSEVSFVVTKEMEDKSRPDKPFTFQLAKADGTLWSGAEYYLYDLRGTSIPGTPGEEDGEVPPGGSTEVSSASTETPPGGTTEGGGTETAPVRLHTENGTFTLKPGQAAVFVGLAVDTVYSVSEVGDPDYIQIRPPALEGYTDRTVQESPVDVLPFVNKEAPKIPTLAVTKVVENAKGDAFDPQDQFHFILRKKDQNNNWQPVNNASYTITVGNDQLSGATGPNTAKDLEAGEFTLHANETARFITLLPGEYQVEEQSLDTRPDYQFRSVTVTRTEPAETGSAARSAVESSEALPADLAGTSAAQSDDSGTSTVLPPLKPGQSATETLGQSGTTGFVFTNTFRPDKLDLALTKQSPSGVTLEGAVFRLWRPKADAALPGTETDFDSIKNQLEEFGESLTTDSDGRLTFEALPAGTWYLEETTPPPGYRVLEAPVKITIDRDDSNNPTVTVTALNSEDRISHTFVNDSDVRDRIELTVTDQYVYELPSTGGPGTSSHHLIGTLILLAAAALYLRSRRYRL